MSERHLRSTKRGDAGWSTCAHARSGHDRVRRRLNQRRLAFRSPSILTGLEEAHHARLRRRHPTPAAE